MPNRKLRLSGGPTCLVVERRKIGEESQDTCGFEAYCGLISPMSRMEKRSSSNQLELDIELSEVLIFYAEL